MKNSADQGGCYPRRLMAGMDNTLRDIMYNISPFLKEFRHFALCFSAHQIKTTLSPGFLGQRFNNMQRAALLTSFWRHQFNNFQRAALLTSLAQYLANSSWLWWIMLSGVTHETRVLCSKLFLAGGIMLKLCRTKMPLPSHSPQALAYW